MLTGRAEEVKTQRPDGPEGHCRLKDVGAPVQGNQGDVAAVGNKFSCHFDTLCSIKVMLQLLATR